jgi:ornithine cyclodeaminase/alanine dehydrogenase-like protein (mu-crystallin family)
MLLIDSNTIGNAAPIEKWVEAMEEALKDTAAGVLEVPQRIHLDRGPNTLLVMPCFGKNYFSTKLVSVFPKNHLKKEPVIYGSVVLNKGETGKPLAVLDGSKLTAMRTAAVGAVGIKYLAPENAGSLGIIGLGIQGFHQALFACQQRPIRKVRIIDHSREIMARFAQRFNAYYPGIEVLECTTSWDLCQNSDIIITATGSHHPVVPGKGEWWKGKTLVGIGSYKPDMKEYPDEIFRDIRRVFVDTLHAKVEAGDLVDPIRKGLIDEKEVLPVTDLILQKSEAIGETRFFKSVGMAAFDLYGAKLVYECIKS